MGGSGSSQGPGQGCDKGSERVWCAQPKSNCKPSADSHLHSKAFLTPGGSASGVGRREEVSGWWLEVALGVRIRGLTGALSGISGA